MPVLAFQGYTVNELRYQKNFAFQGTKQRIDANPKISVKNKLNRDQIIVTMTLQIGQKADEQLPFAVNVSISGTFSYHADQDQSGIGVDTLINKNAVAILYPYLRALVSTVTNASNEYPALILPTINVAQVLEEQGNQLGASS